MDSNRKTVSGMAAYAGTCVPEGAMVDFIYKEDFNGDGCEEAIVGYTQYLPFPPESDAVFIYTEQQENKHISLTSLCGISGPGIPWTFDSAYTADLDGDGHSELVLSLEAGYGHWVSAHIFRFPEMMPVLLWKSRDELLYGSVDVVEDRSSGKRLVLLEGAVPDGLDFLDVAGNNYHVRKGSLLEWDGSSFTEREAEVRPPYRSYNMAVGFINCLLHKDYSGAWSKTSMPEFLGLEGLDDCSVKAFRKYVSKNILPVLKKNLQKGCKLIPREPDAGFCCFSGPEEDFTFEFGCRRGSVLISSMKITKKLKKDHLGGTCE